MTCPKTNDPCHPTAQTTPLDLFNDQGHSALTYRIGTHGHFKEAMLRRLSKDGWLKSLTTRADDDPTIGLLDGWASALDVLTFYQERIINEGFLPTAIERRSVLELANTIGYTLSPGVSAGTYLSFTVEKTPTGDDSVIFHKGLPVQSVPEQDETPQMFETSEDMTARIAWNELVPRQTLPQSFDRTTDTIYVNATSAPVEPGDLILLVGPRRESSPFSERWDVRRVRSAEPLYDEQTVKITWDIDLGHEDPIVHPSDDPKLFRLGKKASLFGFNAADWRGLPVTTQGAYTTSGSQTTEWPDFEIQTVNKRQIDLDREYEGILPKDWVLLDKPSYRELYRVEKSYTSSRNDFGLTGKVTSLELDYQQHLSWFPLRKSTVYISDEQLEIAPRPFLTPVFGDKVTLSNTIPDMEEGRTLVFRGKAVTTLKVAYPMESDSTRDPDDHEVPPSLVLTRLDGLGTVTLAYQETVTLLQPPVRLANGYIRWTVETNAQIPGTVETRFDDLEAVVTEDNDENGLPSVYDSNDTVEVVTIKSMDHKDGHTILVLESPLKNTFIRSSLKIYGNTVFATHGETRSEPLGSGDNSLTHQAFKLRQFPLTYVPSTSASGAQNSLQVVVDGITWNEVSTLYNTKPDDRVFSVAHNDDSTSKVKFGDGIMGERLPTGRDNVTASYRIGIGLDGQVKRGQISLPMNRPLGFKDVVNHIAATGAQDPETRDEGRVNAPQTIITMDRIVSVKDYENFARRYAGIGKAEAIVLWHGQNSIIHLTVGASDGKPVDREGGLMDRLAAAIDSVRHDDQQLFIDTYIEETFGCSFQLSFEQGYNAQVVMASVKKTLSETYSYSNRQFAQGITYSQLLDVVHDVEGVKVAVLTYLDDLPPTTQPQIAAQSAHWDDAGETIIPSALLTIDEEQIYLEEMGI